MLTRGEIKPFASFTNEDSGRETVLEHEGDLPR